MEVLLRKVIKRNGQEVSFDVNKILNAIRKANNEIAPIHKLNEYQIAAVGNLVVDQIEKSNHAVAVEDIQDMVERGIMEMRGYEVAQKYVRYRYTRELARKANTTDDGILSLIDQINEEVKQENSNKNPTINSTQRDYMAGIVCKDMTRRYLLPPEIVQAHDTGILHFHDMDYFGQKALTNCELINLEDMLQNGTVVNEVMIEKPHRLITAATIATQIITAVTSSTYGGATITLTHLAPFVRDSYNIYVEKYRRRGFTEDLVEKYAKEDLKKEIEDSVQTFNYQVNSMTNTNGQMAA